MTPLKRINLRRWLAAKSAAIEGRDCLGVVAPRLHAAYPDLAYVFGYHSAVAQVNWTDADYALWPKSSKKIVIVQFWNQDDGDVLDVEYGNTAPSDPRIADWIASRKAAGYFKPTIYCSLDNAAAVRKATGKYVLGTDYQLWIAHWDDKVAEPQGFTDEQVPVKQYLDAGISDLDAVFDKNWPYRTEPKPPAPKVKYIRLTSPGGLTVKELAAKAGVTEDNLLEASESKLNKTNRAHFENVVAGKLLRGMPYYVKRG